jgi:hypothetical protein
MTVVPWPGGHVVQTRGSRQHDEPRPVVGHRELQSAVAVPGGHDDPRARRVLVGVVDGLQAHEVHGRLDHGGVAPPQPVDVEYDVVVARQLCLERSREPVGHQRDRQHPGRGVDQHPLGGVEPGQEVVHRPTRVLDQREGHLQRDEVVLCAVVQVAFETAPLLLHLGRRPPPVVHELTRGRVTRPA